MTLTRLRSLQKGRGRRAIALLIGGLMVLSVPVAGGSAQAAGQGGAVAALPPRISGVELVVSGSANNTTSFKEANAFCPGNKVVVGGGVWTWNSDARPTLTRFAPIGSGTGFGVSAAQVPPRTVVNWSVDVFAFCANRPPGYEIVPLATNRSAGNVKTADPVCPVGKKVLGSGAQVNYSGLRGGFGLQVVRPAESGDLVRTQARLTPNGPASTPWQLVGYAICSNTPLGYRVVTGLSPEKDSESTKTADVECPLARVIQSAPQQRLRLLGLGGAVANTAPGNASLWRIAPHWGINGLSDDSAFAQAIETTPTSVDWDFIVVRVICVW